MNNLDLGTIEMFREGRVIHYTYIRGSVRKPLSDKEAKELRQLGVPIEMPETTMISPKDDYHD